MQNIKAEKSGTDSCVKRHPQGAATCGECATYVIGGVGEMERDEIFYV